MKTLIVGLSMCLSGYSKRFTSSAHALIPEAVQPTFNNIPFMKPEDYAKSLWEAEEGLYATKVHAILQCHVDDENPPQFRFAYMPMRNRGELIRLILEEAKVPYELECIGFIPWAHGGVKETSPQGKCPILRNFDGHGNDLCQEGTITRFLAEKLGLSGKDPLEKARVDMLYNMWFSTMRNNGISHDGEHYSVASLKQAKDTEPLSYLKSRTNRPPYQTIFRLNSLVCDISHLQFLPYNFLHPSEPTFSFLQNKARRSLMALDYFEDQLERSGANFLVGDSPTYVDLGLFYILFELAENDNVPGKCPY